jgi:hypothetical protein
LPPPYVLPYDISEMDWCWTLIWIRSIESTFVAFTGITVRVAVSKS